MKYFFSGFLILIAVVSSYGQNNDCEVKTTINPATNVAVNVVFTPVSSGTMTVSKSDGKYTFGYMPESIIPFYAAGRILMKIDSAVLLFSDDTRLKLKAEGSGTVNSSAPEKPVFENSYFNCVISDEDYKLISTKIIRSFSITGEKNSTGGESLTEGTATALRRSFSCLQ